MIRSRRRADLVHYVFAAFFGLLFEWTVLGNGPGSNAFQLGMIAMWTTFCFGPRILTRDEANLTLSSRRFWRFFAVTAIGLAVMTLLISNPKARLVVSVVVLSAQYMVMSAWLLSISWRSTARRTFDVKHDVASDDP
jgi:hypothetical protein